MTLEWFHFAVNTVDDERFLYLIPSEASCNFINPERFNSDYLQLVKICHTKDTIYCQLKYVGTERWMLKVSPEIIHRHYTHYQKRAFI